MEDLELTDNQERLLLRYADGECGAVGRHRAEALIRRRPRARAFIDALRELRMEARDMMAADLPNKEPDLWSRIEARIEQEERAAFFLGERRLSRERRFNGPHWFLGISGAAAAAGLAAVILLMQAPRESVNRGPEFAAKSVPAVPETAVRLVSDGLPAGYERPRIIEESAVEMDWLKSDGRVTLIQAPGKRSSAIIWIKRKTERGYPRSGPNPRNGIRIIDDNAPIAVPVKE